MIWKKEKECTLQYLENIVYTSLDGKNWARLPDFFGAESEGEIVINLAHINTRFIRIDLNQSNSCLVEGKEIEVWGLE